MDERTPSFSVITPSYNMLRFLPACCNSIADQGIDFEHIVVDAESSDGTVEWLRNCKGVTVVSEKDEGMYDAVNKGIELADGEVISYLNCDEQYLHGVLPRVGEYFQNNPNVDVLFGNVLIVEPGGGLLAYRKSFVPRWPYIWASFLYVHTSSMFIRKRVFDSGLRFDKKWKAAGDADFVVRLLRWGFCVRHIPEYFSAFMVTGSNLSNSGIADKELIAFRNTAPFWLRHSNPVIHPLIRIEKLLRGAYREKFPLSYSVYTIESLHARQNFVVTQASPLWKRWKLD